MTQKEKEVWKQALTHTHEPDDEKGLNNVDGYIFKEDGIWTMGIDDPAYHNCVRKLSVQFCPWCGKKLE